VAANENLLAASAALKKNSNSMVVMLPQKNHLLQDATTGSPNEYKDIEETMSPIALNMIVDWVTRYTARN
jgi:uncharacterized protein